MSDIFISYSRGDRARVKPLAKALQNICGWSVWWDPYIPAGKSFDEVIEAALDEARCVIVIWSETSIKSHWVKTEAAEGHGRGILVPVSIDNVRIPLAFRRIQTANFTAWKEDTDTEIFQKLQADLTGVLGDPLQNNPAPNLETVDVSKPNEFTKKIEIGKRNIRSQEIGATKTHSKIHSFQEPELIRIPAGKFLMGSPKYEKDRFDNERQHAVIIDDFAIGKYPVTFTEYDRFCEETNQTKPDDEDWGRGSRPVINVSWEDVYDYVEWLVKVMDKPYRLPTEAEWEYAARGGTETAYWWGEKFEKGKINCAGSRGKQHR